MKWSRCLAKRFLVNATIVFFLFFAACTDAGAAFFQKEYLVKQVRGKEVLCDPYVVQKDDWVLRLFRQRGEIAQEDFSRFLEKFDILNPGVKDIDKIYPGQEVLIPLRILPPGSFEGQETGAVTLPVITITNLPEIIGQHSTRYQVRYGDWVSKLIAQRFGPVGSKSYERGMELFKQLNPDIENINFILAGQTIRLPDPDIKESPAYAKIFDDPEDPIKDSPPEVMDLTGVDPSVGRAAGAQTDEPVKVKRPKTGRKDPFLTEAEIVEPDMEEKKPSSLPLPFRDSMRGFADQSIFMKAAVILDADIINSGEYYFPRSGRSDFRLVLSETPLMIFKDGTTLLFTKKQWLPVEDQHAVELYWPDIDIVFFEADTKLDTLIATIVSVIDPEGYERRLDFNDGSISVAVRGQYIYDAPGDFGKICLNIIENKEMRVPRAIRDYLYGMGISVRDRVENENMSGWAGAADTGNYRIPEVKSIPLNPPGYFVKKLVEKLGYSYQSNVDISFSYADFQVSANADMLSLGTGENILIDYGDLGGEAIASIEKSGFNIVQLTRSGDAGEMISQLSELLPVDFTVDPIFWTSARPRLYNPSIQIPGFLVSSGSHEEPANEQLERQRKREKEIERLEEIERQWGAVRHVEKEDQNDENGNSKTISGEKKHEPELFISMVPLPGQVSSYLVESGIRVIEVSARPSTRH